MWLAFPNEQNPKLWVDKNSSLKQAFTLYHPYATLPRLVKSIVVFSPSFLGNLLLKQPKPCHSNEYFSTAKANIDQIIDFNTVINFLPGTKSRHQKITAQVICNGKTAYFVKISDKPETITLSQNEFSILNNLGSLNLSFQTPQARYGDFIGSSYYLVQSAPFGRYRQCPPHFKPANKSALLDMFNIGSRKIRAIEYIAGIRKAIAQCPPELIDPLNNMLDSIEDTYGHHDIYLAMSHGDFTPWNMLTDTDDSLFIFDWEHGNKEMPLLFDFLHFHYMTSKLLKRMSSADIVSYLEGLRLIDSFRDMLKHMDINEDKYRLYTILYMITLISREISETKLYSNTSFRVLEAL